MSYIYIHLAKTVYITILILLWIYKYDIQVIFKFVFQSFIISKYRFIKVINTTFIIWGSWMIPLERLIWSMMQPLCTLFALAEVNSWSKEYWFVFFGWSQIQNVRIRNFGFINPRSNSDRKKIGTISDAYRLGRFMSHHLPKILPLISICTTPVGD